MKLHLPKLVLFAACGLVSLPALADLALATSKNCMSCHNIDKKVVGPSYKDVASKYRGDKTAPARLVAKVMQGGGGVWGVVKMPSNPQLSEAEAKKLVTWVLSQ
jgi:cytochrome c